MLSEQCRSRRRRQYNESKKKGLKQNFVRSVLRKVEVKHNSKEGNYNGKAITEATQDESPNSPNTSNVKKARRTKRLSRICPVTNNIAQNRTPSKQSRITCVSTQSDATAEISQDLEKRGVDDGDKEDEEFNNDLDTMAGVLSIEREETPSPQ
uniref:Uncharacterized protein n=1 Tax=Ascaris lumbricoides TaxID=6252 RepID=A0A0M3I6J4_ASCLU